MLRVGLTGGLASGKSTLALLLAAEGAAVRDADAVVKDLYAPEAAGCRMAVSLFGEEVLAVDGSVNTAALGRLVLGEAEQLHRLEQAIHPLVRKEIEGWLDTLRERQPRPLVAVVEAALLVETGSYLSYHRLVVVSAAEAVRTRRALQNGWPPQRIASVLGAQLQDHEREAVADYVVRNEGAGEELKAAAQRLWRDLEADAILLARGHVLPNRRASS